jgi:hypothetical protein
MSQALSGLKLDQRQYFIAHKRNNERMPTIKAAVFI